MSDSEEEIAEKQFKLVLIGDPQTGKTSMATRYAQESFSKQYSATVGVEFYLKRTVLPGSRSIALKLWDVGGSALDDARMLDKYLYGSDAVVLVYDVSSFATFERLEQWLTTCRSVLSSPATEKLLHQQHLPRKEPMFALVANKIDLEHLRTVKSDRHHKFAQDNSLATYAVSAKSGEGVNLCFQKIAAELLGIRLSKADQEQQQTVVKAEIVTYRHDRVQANPHSSVKTSVCNLQ